MATAGMNVPNPSASRPRRIIIDTDPGVDDALAILLALRSPELRVEAITAVAGNVTLDQATENALKVTELAGKEEVAVARGAAKPLVNKPALAEFVHGAGGLGGVELPAPRFEPDQRAAADLIAETVLAAPGEITLVAIGPLTNLATAFTRDASLAGAVAEVILMGGVCGEGNVTPVAEFNIHTDAEAAKVVFESGAPITMLALDATRQAVLRREHLARLRESEDTVARTAALLAETYVAFGERLGLGGAALHDPLAVGLAIDRGFATEIEPMRVDVETKGEFTYGETVCDRRLVRRPLLDMGSYFRTGEPEPVKPNADVPIKIDGDRFVEFLLTRLRGETQRRD